MNNKGLRQLKCRYIKLLFPKKAGFTQVSRILRVQPRDNSGKMFYFKSYCKTTFISFESIQNNVILPNLKLLEQIVTELLTIKEYCYLVKMMTYIIQHGG